MILFYASCWKHNIAVSPSPLARTHHMIMTDLQWRLENTVFLYFQEEENEITLAEPYHTW